MIPEANITDWRTKAPWTSDQQVEHDLVLTRALVELFSNEFLSERFLLRGGTALNKLYIDRPVRYSEDIDLVQRYQEPIGESLDEIHSTLDSWLGDPRYEQKKRSVTLKYEYEAENTGRPQKLKIEINTREHFAIEGVQKKKLAVENKWFSEAAIISTFSLNELMGTKFRALYQRNKGRDLFDLWYVYRNKSVSPEQVIELFLEYIERQELNITRAMYEQNLQEKKDDRAFRQDVENLLRTDVNYNDDDAFVIIFNEYTPYLPGEQWKPLKSRV
jgi:predicted nucleotidyltransferase component of viral defense system